MTKRRARFLFVMCLGLGLMPGGLGAAEAQPILERLEKRIRSRIDGAPEAADRSQPPKAEQAAVPIGPAPEDAAGEERGYLGLVADDQGEENRGVRVLEVRPGGPAEKAGFKKDDLITSVAGIRVRSLTDMADVLGLFPPGKTIAFDVVRGASQQRLVATLGRPGAAAAAPRVATAERPVEVPQARGGMPPEPPPAASEPAPTVQELLRRIEALERRVAELERALAEPSQP